MRLAFPIPEVTILFALLIIDQVELDHLATCEKLTSIIVSGDDFTSILFPADTFHTVTSLTIQGCISFLSLTHRCTEGDSSSVWREVLPEAHEHPDQGSGKGRVVLHRKGFLRNPPETGFDEYRFYLFIIIRFARSEERPD